jgi:hypothetical protein
MVELLRLEPALLERGVERCIQRFERLLALGGMTRMRVEKAGYLALEFEYSGADERSLDLRLELGQRVLVSVLDAEGKPVEGGAVVLRPIGEGSWKEARAVGVGRFEASGLEHGLHEFELRLAGKTQRVEHEADDPELVFTVERPGEVEVSWTVETSETWLYWLELRLVPVNGTEPESQLSQVSQMSDSTAAPAGSHRFRSVPEGSYEAVLAFQSGDTEVELCRRRLAVRPGATTRVELSGKR